MNQSVLLAYINIESLLLRLLLFLSAFRYFFTIYKFTIEFVFDDIPNFF